MLNAMLLQRFPCILCIQARCPSQDLQPFVFQRSWPRNTSREVTSCHSKFICRPPHIFSECVSLRAQQILHTHTFCQGRMPPRNWNNAQCEYTSRQQPCVSLCCSRS